jgi:hypothetical protein
MTNNAMTTKMNLLTFIDGDRQKNPSKSGCRTLAELFGVRSTTSRCPKAKFANDETGNTVELDLNPEYLALVSEGLIEE